MANCNICNGTLGWGKGIPIIDGKVCEDCASKFSSVHSINSYEVIRRSVIMSKLTKGNFLEQIELIEKNELEISKLTITTKGSRIFVDEINKKWYFDKFNGSDLIVIHDFAEIISYEIFQNDTLISSGGVGSAIVGGLLFGGVGAIVGSNTGSKITSNLVNFLGIKIVLNNIKSPIENVLYWDQWCGALKTSDLKYKNLYDDIEKDKAILDNICTNVETTRKLVVDQKNLESSLNNSIEKLGVIKQMLENGLINQTEFENKKKEILDKI